MTMNLAVNKNILIGYFSVLIILIVSYILFCAFTEKVMQNSFVENSRSTIIYEESNLLYAVKDMESVFKDYLLIKNKESPELFYNGKQTVNKLLKNLETQLAGDSVQLAMLQTLDISIKQEVILMENELYQNSQKTFTSSDSVKNILNSAKQKIDNIRRQVNELQLAQHNFAAKNSNSFNNFNTIKLINVIGLILIILIGFYFARGYSKEKKLELLATEQASSQRKELEEEVKKLAVEKNELTELESVEKFAATGRMARMIAHEVRNPLTNIGLANDQLKDIVEINEESSMLLNMIKRNGERINLLIGDLLNATKFGELHCKNISVNKLLEEVLLSLDTQLKEQNIKVEKDFGKELCDVSADPEKIRIVFFNVILNAIESIKSAEGVLKISTSITEGQCVIKVLDNGGGINENALPKLFEPFFTSKNKGNGLGLTNAQNIVLNHKGKIKAESKVGEGTCFTIGLPCTSQS